MMRSRRTKATGWRAVTPHMVRTVGVTPTFTALRFIHVDDLLTPAAESAPADRKRG